MRLCFYDSPTQSPTDGPTPAPTGNPTPAPTNGPTSSPTDIPTQEPTNPTSNPTYSSIVNCQQSQSCECTPNGNCIFNCEGNGQCAGTELSTAYDGQTITINCVGSSACYGLTGDLSSASSVTWKCQGQDACKYAYLDGCGSLSCNLNCLCDGICATEKSCGDDYTALVNGTIDSCTGIFCVTSEPTKAPTKDTPSASPSTTAPTSSKIEYTSEPTSLSTQELTPAPTENPTMSAYAARQELYSPDLKDLTDLYHVVVGLFTGTIICIGLIAFIDAKFIRINDYFKIGALLTFYMQIMDMISDCFFVAQIHAQNKIDLDDGYTVIFHLSMVFVVLPAMTALFQLYFYAKKHWLENDHTRLWLRKYSSLLLLFSIVTGSSFAATNLLNSYLFQLYILDMGLTQRQLKGFSTKRVYSIVIMEVKLCIFTIRTHDNYKI